MPNPLAKDLDHILAHTPGLWDELRGARIFITGGTGFIGCWLLESLAWANDRLGLKVKAVVLTRNPDAFARKAPHLAQHPAISFHLGDVRHFEFPPGPFSHIIHGASPFAASAMRNAEDILIILDTVIGGTRRVLDFAVARGASRFLFLSSGSVYGKQPADLARLTEDYPGAPDLQEPAAAYGEGKRLAEMLCAIYHRHHGLEARIARCFSFVGPYLARDAHFAIGNFIRDGLQGGPIQVRGDGTPYRSYLYAADLAVWLWTILLRGKPCRPYNVGSAEALTISELATRVAQSFSPPVAVQICRPAPDDRPAERYVPDIRRAATELQLRPVITLEEGIRRMIAG